MTFRFLSALALATALSGAGRAAPVRAAESAGGATRIVAVSYPVWLFARNLLAGLDRYTLEPVLPQGQGCHHEIHYSPGEKRRLLAADILLVAGLGLNDEIAPLLAALPADARQPLVIDASVRPADDEPGWIMEPLPVREPPPSAGGERKPSGVRLLRPNPHYFASPREAARAVRALEKAFLRLSAFGTGRNRAILNANADQFVEQLESLARHMRAELADAPNKRIATQHNAFDYLARDVGLDVAVPLFDEPGHEPSIAQLRHILARVERADVAAVFLEPDADETLAENVRQAVKRPVDVLDAVANGPLVVPIDHYQATMRKNLSVLRAALLPPPSDPAGEGAGVSVEPAPAS